MQITHLPYIACVIAISLYLLYIILMLAHYCIGLSVYPLLSNTHAVGVLKLCPIVYQITVLYIAAHCEQQPLLLVFMSDNTCIDSSLHTLPKHV
jgi:hypothetical protein